MPVTTQSGGLLDTNTWGGTLPSGDEYCIIDPSHTCYLYDGETFECTELLVSGSIITSGNCVLDCDIKKRNSSTIGINIASGQLTIPEPHFLAHDVVGGTGCLINSGVALDIWEAKITSTTNTVYSVINVNGNCTLRTSLTGNFGNVLIVNSTGFCEVIGNIGSSYNTKATVNGGELLVRGNVNTSANEQGTVIGVQINSGFLTIESGVSVFSNGGTCIGVNINGGTIYSSGNISGGKNKLEQVYKFYNKGFNFEGGSNAVLHSWNSLSQTRKHFIPYWIDNSTATVNLHGFDSVSQTYGCHDPTVSIGRGTLNWVNQTQFIPTSGKICIHHHNGNLLNNSAGGTVNLSGLQIENYGTFIYSRDLWNGSSSYIPLITDQNTQVKNYENGTAAVFSGDGIKVLNRPIVWPNTNGGADQ